MQRKPRSSLGFRSLGFRQQPSQSAGTDSEFGISGSLSYGEVFFTMPQCTPGLLGQQLRRYGMAG